MSKSKKAPAPIELKRGMKVLLKRSSQFWGQSGGTVGTVLRLDERDDEGHWWKVRWGKGHGRNCYHPYDLSVVGKPGRKVIASADKMTPREFAREHGLCSAFRKAFSAKKWSVAFDNALHMHGGAEQMCDWLEGETDERFKCLCGEPFAVWKATLEKTLNIKLVDGK